MTWHTSLSLFVIGNKMRMKVHKFNSIALIISFFTQKRDYFL
nr:MAG TPA: hypothetical protein [Caudoviricetes sp.]